VGTAAPVLGLAAVVSLADLTRFESAHLEWLGREILASLEGFCARPASGIYRLLVWLNRAGMFLAYAALAQLANVALQTVLLAVSLWAIISQANEGPPLLWLAVAVLGMALLAVAGIASTFVRWGVAVFEERRDRDPAIRTGESPEGETTPESSS
jgi:hypothetical protein